ncbi:hypothetical protein NEUTE2DRAFT_56115 [Neurospora tetrasperma FGSC 2509]|nr:hypothetical protein NEUTE2DRAFT_56115 [Neurospora tetrasperma FGSC 2509]
MITYVKEQSDYLSGNIQVVLDVGLATMVTATSHAALTEYYSSYIKPLHPSFSPSEQLSTLPRQTGKHQDISSWPRYPFVMFMFCGQGHAVG